MRTLLSSSCQLRLEVNLSHHSLRPYTDFARQDCRIRNRQAITVYIVEYTSRSLILNSKDFPRVYSTLVTLIIALIY